MSAHDLLGRIYDAVNTGRLDDLDELVEPGYTEHADGTVGVEAFRQRLAVFRAAFPDLHVAVEEVIDGGSVLASRTTITGTHTGDLMGMPPTGNPIRLTAVDIVRLGADGRAAERWGGLDMYALMSQLGALAAPAPA